MPRNFLLLADADALGRLRAAGMSDQILVDGEPHLPGEVPAPEHDFIERRDPASLVSLDADGEVLDTQANVEHRDELFATLLGSVVCHLVVLENEPAGSQPAGDRAVLKDASPLDRLSRWYETFRREVAERVDYRQHEYRHILILVCAEDIPKACLLQLNELLACGDGEPAIHACYVMLRRLNWGAANVCHSRYVWPLSVARLLVYHLATDSASVARASVSGDPVTLAWRAIELVPDIAPAEVEEHFRQRLDKLVERFSTASPDEGGSDWNAKAFDPDPDVPKARLPEKEFSHRGPWNTFDAPRAVEDATDAKMWEEELRRTGGNLVRAIAARLLSEDLESWQQIGRVWGSVHLKPSALWAALRERGVIHGPDVAAELQKLGGEFEALREILRQRDEAIEDAARCATMLEEAQCGFVDLGRRFLFAGVAAGAVAYASILVFHMLLGGWSAALLVACFGVLGAICALVGPRILEEQAGKQAVEAFQKEILVDLQQRTIDQDSRCQNLVANGHRFWAKSRAASASRRLGRLLRRFHSMIEQELVTHEPDAEFDEEEEPDEFGATSPSNQRRRESQQRLYLKFTRVRRKIESFKPDADALDGVMENRISRFKELWGRLCRDHDGCFAGNMPAGEWIPALDDFRDGFRAAISDEIHRQAIAQMADDRRQEWGDELQRFLNEPYHYYLSCPVTSEHVDPKFRTIRLLLRSQLQKDDVGHTLQNVSVDYPAVMDWLPMFGLLFEEMPIRLGEGEEFIEAVDHEA